MEKKTDKERMITDILQACAAGGCFISGELFFSLAFRTDSELRAICRELCIKPPDNTRA